MKTHLNLTYLALAVILFITEVLIALYAHDQFIRPIFGDVLVVILIYCFVKAFVNTPVVKTCIAVLLFSYLVELTQFFQLVNLIGLGENKLAKIVMGSFFSWTDLLAYTIGIIIVLIIERTRKTI